jgi:hypothetical protein
MNIVLLLLKKQKRQTFKELRANNELNSWNIQYRFAIPTI